MKRAIFGILLLLIVAALAFTRLRLPPRKSAEVDMSTPGSAEPVAVDHATTTPPVESASETVEVPHEEQAFIEETVAYAPPPTINQTGSTLGRQRVPGTEKASDIYQLYFNKGRQELVMTAVEPGDLRSVWRLDQNGKFERAFTATGGLGDIFIHGDSRGIVYVQHDNPAKMYRSTDDFRTWQEVEVAPAAMFWSIADDGNGTLYGTTHEHNTAILYRSTDDGFHWTPWVDFQKLYPEEAVTYRAGDDRFRLRHLHDVIYDQLSNRIIVGTGDVARFAVESADGGKTWKRIWDEGFTAHALVGRGTRYLLCPDRLRAAGLALYDAAKGPATTVWFPADYNFAGYCYSVINAGGTFYAAFHTEANESQNVVPKSGIIVSPDAETWYPFLEWPPLNQHARTNIWMAEGSSIIYASVNGALYAFRPLDKDWFLDKKPFGK